MTAVDHAELKRLADALRVSWSDRGWTPAKKIDGLLKEARQAADGLDALLSEIEGLKAERDRLSGQYEIDTEIINNLRTQAPDSWRPSLIDMARAIYDAPTRFDGDAVGTHLGRSEMVDCSARTAAEEREIVLCMCEDAASAILALRPQTAESWT